MECDDIGGEAPDKKNEANERTEIFIPRIIQLARH